MRRSSGSLDTADVTSGSPGLLLMSAPTHEPLERSPASTVTMSAASARQAPAQEVAMRSGCSRTSGKTLCVLGMPKPWMCERPSPELK